MTCYALANPEVSECMLAVMEQYHGELHDVGVRVDILFAHADTDQNGDPKGPAIKHKGHGCAAQVRIMALRDRVAGRGDAEITLDGDEYDVWSGPQLRAILDHELEHLEVCYTGDGSLKRDDAGRPRLRLRPHDQEYGWFDAVARRHGEDSVEVRQSSRIVDREELQQLYLPGLDQALAKGAP